MVSYYISSSNQNKLHSGLSSHPAFALDSLQTSSAATNITSQQRTKERERVGYLKNTDADKYHVLKPVMHRIQKKTQLKIKKTIITNTFCKLVRLTLWRDFSKQTYSFNQLAYYKSLPNMT